MILPLLRFLLPIQSALHQEDKLAQAKRLNTTHLERKQQNNEENIHHSTCVYLVYLDYEISVPHIIRHSMPLTWFLSPQ